jgi:2-oxoglutarate ferredoxin oxidoreductase subunit gamma
MMKPGIRLLDRPEAPAGGARESPEPCLTTPLPTHRLHLHARLPSFYIEVRVMSDRYEVRLSGAGGQGLILVGKILAEAAAIYDNKNATQSQSYGPEARGGASRSEVIISDGDIDYPKATHIDLLLAMTQEAADKYAKDVKPGGTIIVDTSFVERAPAGEFSVHAYPITKLAEEQVGRAIVANIVALGVIQQVSRIVSEDAILTAIRSRVPKGTEEMNIKAFRIGQEQAAK